MLISFPNRYMRDLTSELTPELLRKRHSALLPLQSAAELNPFHEQLRNLMAAALGKGRLGTWRAQGNVNQRVPSSKTLRRKVLQVAEEQLSLPGLFSSPDDPKGSPPPPSPALAQAVQVAVTAWVACGAGLLRLQTVEDRRCTMSGDGGSIWRAHLMSDRIPRSGWRPSDSGFSAVFKVVDEDDRMAIALHLAALLSSREAKALTARVENSEGVPLSTLNFEI
jgi:hypothetical protein